MANSIQKHIPKSQIPNINTTNSATQQKLNSLFCVAVCAPLPVQPFRTGRSCRFCVPKSLSFDGMFLLGHSVLQHWPNCRADCDVQTEQKRGTLTSTKRGVNHKRQSEKLPKWHIWKPLDKNASPPCHRKGPNRPNICAPSSRVSHWKMCAPHCAKGFGPVRWWKGKGIANCKWEGSV